jgi:hypothetical protein
MHQDPRGSSKIAPPRQRRFSLQFMVLIVNLARLLLEVIRLNDF